MCGISGIVYFDSQRAGVPVLRAVNDAIAHRGPDDEGFCLVGDQGEPTFCVGDDSPNDMRRQFQHIEQQMDRSIRIGVGHRRFSIIDPSPGGHQPWFDSDSQTVVVFNGEIYNYRELRDELVANGPFQGESDTEVFARAYAAWGTDCFQRFNGFWAAAILDLRRRRLILTRDRFGKKPLYVHQPDRNTLVFSSEIRSLMKAVPGDRGAFAVDDRSMLLYLLYDRRSTMTGCMWRDIEMLPQATYRVINIDGGDSVDHRYWSLPTSRLSEHEYSFDRAQSKFDEVFTNAVRLRLRADVPLAANLSGGMDSSAIVAVAQEILGTENPLQTHIIRYRDAPELDENQWADAVAQHVQCDHHETFIDQSEAWSHFDHLVETLEEPVHSMAFMTQWIGWRAIAESGIKVILHGAAADEMLAGYQYLPDLYDFESLSTLNLPRYFRNRPITQVKRHLQAVKWAGHGRVFPRLTNPIRSLLGHVNRWKHNRNYEPERFATYFAADFLRETQDFHQAFDERFTLADRTMESRIAADVEWLRIPYWNSGMDKTMMDIPVEVRIPFLDYRVVETLLTMPAGYLYRHGWTKYILRKTVESKLPESVVWRRKKMGFTVPKQRWLDAQRDRIITLLESNRSPLSAFVNVDTMLASLDTVPADILWRTVNVAKWIEAFTPRI